MPRSTYKISHHFSSLRNRWPNWHVSKQNLFYTKIPIPLHIFPPTYLDANLPSSNVHRHDARRSLHPLYTARDISIDYIRSTKVGHVLHPSPLSPPLQLYIRIRILRDTHFAVRNNNLNFRDNGFDSTEFI